MKYFFDTEFIEWGQRYPIDLISIGIIDENGREYYAISNEFKEKHANSFVKEHVFCHLNGPRIPLSQIRNEILDFIGSERPEFWAYFAAYDWVVFCQLFGTMVQLPRNWPQICMDVKQLAILHGNPQLPSMNNAQHHALADAKECKYRYEFLTDYIRAMKHRGRVFPIPFTKEWVAQYGSPPPTPRLFNEVEIDDQNWIINQYEFDTLEDLQAVSWTFDWVIERWIKNPLPNS